MFDPRSKYYLPTMLLIISLVGALVAWGVIHILNDGPDGGKSVANIPANSPKDIGSGVAVYGAKVPASMKAEPIQGDYPVDHAQVTSLSDVVRITPEGKLPGKTTLVFTLKQRVDLKNGAVFVATRETGKNWTFISPQLSADGTTASVEVDHLSDWWMFFVDVTRFLGKPLKDFLASVFLKPFEEAKVPSCPKDQVKRATSDNYKVEKKTGDAIASCFARKDDKSKRTMTVTNERRYPLEADHPGFKVIDAGRHQANFANLARLGSGKKSILYPHATIQYSVELEMNRYAKVATEYSGIAANYARMDIALETLAYIVAKLNIKFVTSVDDNMKAIDTMLGIHECARAAAGKNFGEIMHKCFVSGVLGQLYGNVGIVMGGLAVVTGLVSWLTSEFSYLNDVLRGRDNATVTVARVSPFARYVGRHYAQDSALVILPNGTGYFESETQGEIYRDQFKLVMERNKVHAVITEPSDLLDDVGGDIGMSKGMRIPLYFSKGGYILNAEVTYVHAFEGVTHRMVYAYCTPNAPEGLC